MCCDKKFEIPNIIKLLKLYRRTLDVGIPRMVLIAYAIMLGKKKKSTKKKVSDFNFILFF